MLFRSPHPDRVPDTIAPIEKGPPKLPTLVRHGHPAEDRPATPRGSKNRLPAPVPEQFAVWGLASCPKAIDGLPLVVGIGIPSRPSKRVAVDDDRVLEVVDGAGGEVGEAEAAQA